MLAHTRRGSSLRARPSLTSRYVARYGVKIPRKARHGKVTQTPVKRGRVTDMDQYAPIGIDGVRFPVGAFPARG